MEHDEIPAADFDSPWKEVLEHYFESFMLLLFPYIHAEIDWTKVHDFLDKESGNRMFWSFSGSSIG